MLSPSTTPFIYEEKRNPQFLPHTLDTQHRLNINMFGECALCSARYTANDL